MRHTQSLAANSAPGERRKTFFLSSKNLARAEIKWSANIKRKKFQAGLQHSEWRSLPHSKEAYLLILTLSNIQRFLHPVRDVTISKFHSSE